MKMSAETLIFHCPGPIDHHFAGSVRSLPNRGHLTKQKKSYAKAD